MSLNVKNISSMFAEINKERERENKRERKQLNPEVRFIIKRYNRALIDGLTSFKNFLSLSLSLFSISHCKFFLHFKDCSEKKLKLFQLRFFRFVFDIFAVALKQNLLPVQSGCKFDSIISGSNQHSNSDENFVFVFFSVLRGWR